MREGHAMAKGPLTLGRFCSARHLLVSFSGKPHGFIDTALETLGRKRRIVMTVNQFYTAARVVADSDLLTVLPRHFLARTGFSQALTSRQLPFEVPAVHIDAFWHTRKDTSSPHRWLRDVIARSVRADSPLAAP